MQTQDELDEMAYRQELKIIRHEEDAAAIAEQQLLSDELKLTEAQRQGALGLELKGKLLAAEMNLLKIQDKKEALREKKKEEAKKKKADAEKKRMANEIKMNEFMHSKEMGMAKSAMSNMSALMKTKNKDLFEIGKVFAKGAAVINIAQGVTKAFAQGGGILGPILAASVIAAGAVQLAAINSQSVPMAEGGSVEQPTNILAGEAGKEAIIPLEDDSAGLGNITVNVGAFMGDEEQAYELAGILDEQLFKRRLNNESISFDSGVV